MQKQRGRPVNDKKPRPNLSEVLDLIDRGEEIPVREVEEEEGNEIAEATQEDLEAATAEEWIERNTARDLSYFSKRARSGRDPVFTMEFMKSTMGLLTARAKAKIDGTASVLSSQNGDRKLIEAARAAGELSQGDLMKALRDLKV